MDVMTMLNEIIAFLKQNTRNKIVFCRGTIESIDFINVGRELSILLNERFHDLSGYETMVSQVMNRSNYNAKIGLYLAIENIGILFESELKLDLRSVLNHYSKNQCLIIKTDSVIENDNLYFINVNVRSFVNLKGLSYVQI